MRQDAGGDVQREERYGQESPYHQYFWRPAAEGIFALKSSVSFTPSRIMFGSFAMIAPWQLSDLKQPANKRVSYERFSPIS